MRNLVLVLTVLCCGAIAQLPTQPLHPYPVAEGDVPAQKMLAAVRELARQRGAGPDVTQRMMIEALGEMHTGRVDLMLAEDRFADARKYFASIKRTEIDPQVSLAIQQKIDRVALPDDSLRLALAVMKETQLGDKLFESGFDLWKAIGLVEARYKAKTISIALMDATQDRLREEHARIEKILFDARKRGQAEQRSAGELDREVTSLRREVLELRSDVASLQKDLNQLKRQLSDLLDELARRGGTGR